MPATSPANPLLQPGHRVHYPSWCGDFTLSGDDKLTVLAIKDATAVEVEVLRKLLYRARDNGWIPKGNSLISSWLSWFSSSNEEAVLPDVSAPGLTTVKLQAGLAAVSGALGEIMFGNCPTLTVTKHTDGRVEVVTALGAPPMVTPTPASAAPTPAAAPAEPPVTVVVTKPTKCCPYPVLGDRDQKAEALLLAFCTEEQRETWNAHGWIHVYGGATGTAYRVYHRQTPEAVAARKIVVDLDDNRNLHAWDWSTPPAEEVLRMALILAHKEEWLRNPETTGFPLNGWSGAAHFWGQSAFRDVSNPDHNAMPRFNDPNGRGFLDGTADAGFLSGVGLIAHALQLTLTNPTAVATVTAELLGFLKSRGITGTISPSEAQRWTDQLSGLGPQGVEWRLEDDGEHRRAFLSPILTALETCWRLENHEVRQFPDEEDLEARQEGYSILPGSWLESRIVEAGVLDEAEEVDFIPATPVLVFDRSRHFRENDAPRDPLITMSFGGIQLDHEDVFSTPTSLRNRSAWLA